MCLMVGGSGKRPGTPVTGRWGLGRAADVPKQAREYILYLLEKQMNVFG